MTRRIEGSQARSARLLAGVLLLGLSCAWPAPLKADRPDASAPSAPIPVIDGPAAVSLGAEAVLALPAGWRFVPAAGLPAWFAEHPGRPGPWDRGLVLSQEPAAELRLLFEPLGAVAVEPLPPADAMLPPAQAVARALRKAARPGVERPRELAFWRWEPSYDPEHQLLRFGGVWREDEDELVSLHWRWLGRRGVLKLDWRGPEDDANALVALGEQLDAGLRFEPGQALAQRQPGDRQAGLGLNGLVLDGLFGRRAGVPGGSEPLALPPGAWIGVFIAGLVALLWAAVKGWRGLEAWLGRRQKRRQEAQRLDYIEKKYGGRADEVEDIEEDGQEGYGAPK